ncbi:MAG: GIY-YIG nuclease family protein [Planctomycetes bacterium]|nr:GIY-YIG nuclease family protein [Planctomycetota bacterium]
MKGRTIKLFLVSGSTAGLRSAEVLNWTGKVFVCPRSQLKDLLEREEVAATGIYFLVGRDLTTGELKVYVGESDDVATRLKTHNSDKKKDFWEDTIVIVSKDEHLTKSHVAYLEHRMQTLVKEAGKAKLETGVEPTKKLPESDLADMQFFESQILMLMPVVGCDWLTQPAKAPVQGEEFELTIPTTDLKAKAFQSEGGEFVVRAGSHARLNHVASLGANYKLMRTQLEADGLLAKAADGKTLVFKADTPFNSPSAAACVVTGTQTNGRDTWMIGSKTYAKWDEARLLR